MIEEKICYVICFISEALTAWLYLDFVFERKRSTSSLSCFFLIGYALLFLVSGYKNSNINATFFCVVNYVVIKCNFRCSKKAALLHTTLLCFFMAGSEILAALVFNVFGFGFSADKSNVWVLFMQILLGNLVYLVFAALGSRMFSSHKDQRNDPQLMVLFCSLPVLSAFIAILSVYLGTTTGVSTESGVMMLITIVALLCVNLVFLVLYNYIEKANDEYMTLQLSLQKEQADIAYYKALQDQFESQRILVHDIKKHLGVIEALAKQSSADEIEKYVSELNVSLAPSNQAKLCADSILNLLLLHFRDKCRVSGVAFQCDIRENVSAFMDASSVTTLYGNLLSNALESAILSDEKQIELSATWNAEHTVVVISVVNSCAIAPTPDGSGSFRTSKENKNHHGVGLRSIERVVKKYCGNATMYYDGATKQFHHVIQFFTNYS